MSLTVREIMDALKDAALRLGFDAVGVAPAVRPPHLDHFRRWLAAGHAAEMQYLPDRAAAGAYDHPDGVLQGTRSVLMLATNYRTVEPVEPGPGQGRVGRYAWGTDYHDVIRHRLQELTEIHRRLLPEGQARGVVDTAPILERDFAWLAGLGWIGKNTTLINDRLGSWLFLAALLTTAELPCDQPVAESRCGDCRACLDACPTGALREPYELDARRCLSYLTIESHGPMPEELRSSLQERIFGCDACQQACPFNGQTPTTAERAFFPRPAMNPMDLAELFFLDEVECRERFRGSPLRRAKRVGLLRNAALALADRPSPAATAALKKGLQDPDPLVREACDWALAAAEQDSPST